MRVCLESAVERSSDGTDEWRARHCVNWVNVRRLSGRPRESRPQLRQLRERGRFDEFTRPSSATDLMTCGRLHVSDWERTTPRVQGGSNTQRLMRRYIPTNEDEIK